MSKSSQNESFAELRRLRHLLDDPNHAYDQALQQRYQSLAKSLMKSCDDNGCLTVAEWVEKASNLRVE